MTTRNPITNQAFDEHGNAYTIMRDSSGNEVTNSFRPSAYTGALTVTSQTGVSTAIATGAKFLRLIISEATATAPLFMAFGTDSADAIANVEGTSGSEAGILLSTAPAVNDTWSFAIPASATYVAFAVTGAAKDVDVWITQGA